MVPRNALRPRLLAPLALAAVSACAPGGAGSGGPDAGAAGGKADELRQGETFTVAVLPDTQHYVEWWKRNADVFRSQTRWIAKSAGPENIRFVSHVGDVVENGWIALEWRRAARAMDLLDGAVRYGTLPGNHDYRKKNARGSGAPLYVRHFGRSRYRRHPWATLSPNQRNSVHTFDAGGRRFLHIGLEWEAPDPTLAWAQRVLDRHPGTPTIVSTHALLNRRGRLHRPTLTHGGNSGRAMWNEFISKNDQIFMVVNGHFAAASRRVLRNDAGNRVFAMMADYSFDRPNGGNGFLRLIRFDTARDAIRVETYSPYADRFLRGPKHQFSFPFDLDRRFGGP